MKRQLQLAYKEKEEEETPEYPITESFASRKKPCYALMERSNGVPKEVLHIILRRCDLFVNVLCASQVAWAWRDAVATLYTVKEWRKHVEMLTTLEDEDTFFSNNDFDYRLWLSIARVDPTPDEMLCYCFRSLDYSVRMDGTDEEYWSKTVTYDKKHHLFDPMYNPMASRDYTEEYLNISHGMRIPTSMHDHLAHLARCQQHASMLLKQRNANILAGEWLDAHNKITPVEDVSDEEDETYSSTVDKSEDSSDESDGSIEESS
jgi:hypothetical protein